MTVSQLIEVLLRLQTDPDGQVRIRLGRQEFDLDPELFRGDANPGDTGNFRYCLAPADPVAASMINPLPWSIHGDGADTSLYITDADGNMVK